LSLGRFSSLISIAFPDLVDIFVPLFGLDFVWPV
jgi:hypothetical protein